MDRHNGGVSEAQPVNQRRDYVDWHHWYDDPTSGMSWRLQVVRGYLVGALDRQPGPLTALSLCAGDGRDLLGVLAERSDAERVRAVLVELHPQLAEAARVGAASAGLADRVEVRTADASTPSTWADVVPADLVLLVGIFGNISDADLWRTLDAAPALCAPGATLLWSRGRDRTDLNPRIRTRLTAAGFTELSYDELDRGSHPSVGALRYDGPPQPLPDVDSLFTFIR